MSLAKPVSILSLRISVRQMSNPSTLWRLSKCSARLTKRWLRLNWSSGFLFGGYRKGSPLALGDRSRESSQRRPRSLPRMDIAAATRLRVQSKGCSCAASSRLTSRRTTCGSTYVATRAGLLSAKTRKFGPRDSKRRARVRRNGAALDGPETVWGSRSRSGSRGGHGRVRASDPRAKWLCLQSRGCGRVSRRRSQSRRATGLRHTPSRSWTGIQHSDRPGFLAGASLHAGSHG
jgi:hypothetical protein